MALYFRNLKKENPAEDIYRYHSLKDFRNPLSEILDTKKKEKLTKALNKLDEKYRDVLIMRVYDELSIDEISHQIGIEKRRLSERINYALKLLLKGLKKQKYFQ